MVPELGCSGYWQMTLIIGNSYKFLTFTPQQISKVQSRAIYISDSAWQQSDTTQVDKVYKQQLCTRKKYIIAFR